MTDERLQEIYEEAHKMLEVSTSPIDADIIAIIDRLRAAERERDDAVRRIRCTLEYLGHNPLDAVKNRLLDELTSLPYHPGTYMEYPQPESKMRAIREQLAAEKGKQG